MSIHTEKVAIVEKGGRGRQGYIHRWMDGWMDLQTDKHAQGKGAGGRAITPLRGM